MSLNSRTTLNVQLKHDDPDAEWILDLVQDYKDRGQAVGNALLDGLRLLKGYRPRYADNAVGKLARMQDHAELPVRDEEVTQRLAILDDRITTLMEMLRGMQMTGSAPPAPSAELPNFLEEEMRRRFESMNSA